VFGAGGGCCVQAAKVSEFALQIDAVFVQTADFGQQSLSECNFVWPVEIYTPNPADLPVSSGNLCCNMYDWCDTGGSDAQAM